MAARWLPPRGALRCVLFHQIADQPSPFTDGLDVRVTAEQFADRLEFLLGRYSFVDLGQVLAGVPPSPRPPLLLTFDDAYRGVLDVAAPLCAERGVPAVFFVNGSLVENRTLAIDNLVAYIVNSKGMGVVERVGGRRFAGPADVLVGHLGALTLAERRAFQRRLVDAAGVDPLALAAEAGLYIDEAQLARAAEDGIEIGNHTWSHVHCDALAPAELEAEVVGNRTWLEQRTGRPVRAFSYPYGRRPGPQVHRLVTAAGHSASFLADAYANRRPGEPHTYDRVTLPGGTDAETFRDVEVRPRLRAVRRLLR